MAAWCTEQKITSTLSAPLFNTLLRHTHVRIQLALGMGLFCQEIDQAFGLFLTANIPGGGLSYLLTYLVNGDRQLSASLSLLSSCLDVGELIMFFGINNQCKTYGNRSNLHSYSHPGGIRTVTCPLWMITVGWYWFNRSIHIGRTVAWLLLITAAQLLGILLRGCRPGVAMAVLTWITRPLLLLSGILLITLGVYINHYAFTEISQNLILCLLALITAGFIFGWIGGQLVRQGIEVCKTLATEAAVFNGLLCMPLLRTSLHAPEGDLAAVVCLWAIFLTPIPLAYNAVLSVVHNWALDFFQRRRKTDEANNPCGLLLDGTSRYSNHELDDMRVASMAAIGAAAMDVVPAISNQTKTTDQNKQVAIWNHERRPDNVSDGYGTDIRDVNFKDQQQFQQTFPTASLAYLEDFKTCAIGKDQPYLSGQISSEVHSTMTTKNHANNFHMKVNPMADKAHSLGGRDHEPIQTSIKTVQNRSPPYTNL